MTHLHRVLVVDDDHYNLTLLENLVGALGYEPILARSGFEALEKVFLNVDLVLLDVMMPQLDGYEVAGRIRANPETGDIPIIMVTVLDSKEDRLRAVESGANDFITKPVDSLELRVRTASLLKMKAAQDRIKAALVEKDVLLREIHHRVKNNLAIVNSLLRLQSQYAADDFHRKMFADTQNRIKSMALAHEKLYQAENLAALNMPTYIGSLVDHLVDTSRTIGRRIRLTKRIDDVYLTLETAVPLGIILTEVVSNCLRHAFTDGREGMVTISLRDAGSREYELAVNDNGVGMAEGIDCFSARSFGLRLLRIFSEQLDAVMQFTTSDGTEFRLRFAETKKSGFRGA